MKKMDKIKDEFDSALFLEEKEKVIWKAIEGGELSKEFSEFFTAVVEGPLYDEDVEPLFWRLPHDEQPLGEVILDTYFD